MIKRIRYWFRKFKFKWVLGDCRHFCSLCEFKANCDIDFDLESFYIDTDSVYVESDNNKSRQINLMLNTRYGMFGEHGVTK